MIDVAPLWKSVNQTMVDPIIPKKMAKATEEVEPTNHRPTLLDIHISDAKDFHPNTVLPLMKQTTKLEPSLNGDQLLKILSFMRKQMENQ